MEENNTMEEKKTILVVDDEKNIVNVLVHNLQSDGYNTIEAYDGMTAVSKAIEYRPDLILLDIMLPRLDGLSVCKKIKNTYNVPIIMLTAKDGEIDKILGLELGADDYITKPFSIRELLARVKANLRKREFEKEDVEYKNDASTVRTFPKKKEHRKVKIGDMELDLERYEVKIKDRCIDLTLREFEVLKFLALEPGQVITREVLLEKVWGYEYYGDIRTVDVTVRGIREKIEEDTSNPKMLITKRGVGYYLAIPD